MTRQLLSLAIALPPGLDAAAVEAIARMASRLQLSAIYLASASESADLEALVEAASPALVVVGEPQDMDGVVHVNDPAAVAAARQVLNATDSSCPLLVAVPISVGRTMSEAVARADLEPRFRGDRHPSKVGIFGAFERAQEQVLALARASADGLILDIPLGNDVADFLAQVRALVVGATPQLMEAEHMRQVPAPKTVFYS